MLQGHTHAKFCKVNWKQFSGFFFILLSSIFLTLSLVFVKKLTYIDTGELSLIRNTGIFVFCLPITVYYGEPMFGPKEKRIMLFVAGFLGSFTIYLHTIAFRYLPVADAAILVSTFPVMTSFTARVYLKEDFGLVQSIAMLIAFIGVTLSVRLPEILKNREGVYFDIDYVTGLCSAVGSVFTLSLSMTLMRKMQAIGFLVVLIYYSLTGILQNVFITSMFSFYSLPRCGWDRVQVLLIGILGFFGNASYIMGVQNEEAGIASILLCSFDIIIAMVFQIAFFDLAPDLYVIGSAIMVISSVAILGIRRWLLSLPEESNARQKCKCLI